MCVLTMATAVSYTRIVHLRRAGREYNFVVRTDDEGVVKIRSDLAVADLHGVRQSQIEDGLYRITVRCPPEKIGAMWSVMSGLLDRRFDK